MICRRRHAKQRQNKHKYWEWVWRWRDIMTFGSVTRALSRYLCVPPLLACLILSFIFSFSFVLFYNTEPRTENSERESEIKQRRRKKKLNTLLIHINLFRSVFVVTPWHCGVYLDYSSIHLYSARFDVRYGVLRYGGRVWVCWFRYVCAFVLLIIINACICANYMKMWTRVWALCVVCFIHMWHTQNISLGNASQ